MFDMLKGILSNVYAEIDNWGVAGTSSVMLLILGISLLILGPNVEPVYVSLSGETTRIGLIMSGLFLSGFGGFGIARQMGISISIRYER